MSILLKSRLDITNVSKNHVTNRPHFVSGKGGHGVTEHFEEGGCNVTCDKPSTSKLGWTKKVDEKYLGVRKSQGRIVTANSLLYECLLRVELSRDQFVGGRITKAPSLLSAEGEGTHL
jgi:hypothetical protein